MQYPRRSPRFRRFLAAVLDGPAPDDLSARFVRRELLRKVMEDFDTPDWGETSVQVALCLARPAAPPRPGWGGAAHRAAIAARVPLRASDEEGWHGFFTGLRDVFGLWHGALLVAPSGNGRRAAAAETLAWMESLLDGTLDDTHPGQDLRAVSCGAWARAGSAPRAAGRAPRRVMRPPLPRP